MSTRDADDDKTIDNGAVQFDDSTASTTKVSRLICYACTESPSGNVVTLTIERVDVDYWNRARAEWNGSSSRSIDNDANITAQRGEKDIIADAVS